MEPQWIEVGAGAARRRIAVLLEPGREPGLLWLPGFKSEMTSTKATALAEWARRSGRALVRLDYSGHGQSGGRFEDGTIGRWLEETRQVFSTLTCGRQIVIGSSMGGYLALLLLRGLLREEPAEASRIAALLLIAPAWDMTEELMWKAFPEPVRRVIERQGLWLRPSQYGEAHVITRALIEDGRRHLLGDASWDPGRPVVVLHGRQDPDVPLAHSHRLASILFGGRMRLIEVADGDHRLSRPEDIARLLETVGSLS